MFLSRASCVATQAIYTHKAKFHGFMKFAHHRIVSFFHSNYLDGFCLLGFVDRYLDYVAVRSLACISESLK